jgi:hypothetical protein
VRSGKVAGANPIEEAPALCIVNIERMCGRWALAKYAGTDPAEEAPAL